MSHNKRRALPERLSTTVETERQARELAKAPEEKRAEVKKSPIGDSIDNQRQAYELIASANAVKSLPEECNACITNPRQATELAKAPEAKRAKTAGSCPGYSQYLPGSPQLPKGEVATVPATDHVRTPGQTLQAYASRTG